MRIALRGVFATYERALLTRPLMTKARSSLSPLLQQRIHFVRLLNGRRVCRFASQATTSACVGGVGDLACQLIDDPTAKKGIDPKRLVLFAGLGGVMVGPTLHAWYSLLHRSVPGNTALDLCKRLALDQLLFAPLFIPSFMSVLLTLEGHPQPIVHVQHAWWQTVLQNWKLWVPAQLINFGVIPLHFQVLFANGVAVAWNAYLSFASHTSSSLDSQSAVCD